MNKLKLIAFVWISMFFYSPLSFANNNEVSAINNVFSDSEIALQIKSISSHIDLRYNDEVKKILNTYLNEYRSGTEVIISRSHYYFPIIENIIRKHNLPEEIKFLSVVESSLNPVVRSKAGAVGLWQFMRSTARMYGLTVSGHYDERKDVTRSTEAALLYLNDLYERYDDWTLAMAAYNCGPGNVNKAISRANSKNYWEIRKYLPKETRRYLPKFVAFSYIMTYAEQIGLHDLGDISFTDYSSFGSVRIYNRTYLKTISTQSGMPLSEIKKFNPSYVGNVIPERKDGNMLILPEMYMLTYLSNTGRMEDLEHVFYLKNKMFEIKESEEFEDFESLELIDDLPLDRAWMISQFLRSNPLDKFEFESELKEINPRVDLTNEVYTFRKIRLKKRQTLKDLIGEEELELAISDNVGIQPTGTIQLRN